MSNDETPAPQVVHVKGLASARALGVPPLVTTSAGYDWLVVGFDRALARFLGVTARGEPVDEVYIPLFETLNWAVAIEEYTRERRQAITDAALQGVRFARNRVHHQWADALQRRDVPNPAGLVIRGGPGARVIAPPTIVEWVWKPVERLPKPPVWKPDLTGRKAYVAHLAERQARDTFEHLKAVFDSA